MAIGSETTPLISDRWEEESSDSEQSEQSYSTFFNKSPVVTGAEESPFTSDEGSIDDASTKSGGGQFLGSVTSIIVVLLLGKHSESM